MKTLQLTCEHLESLWKTCHVSDWIIKHRPVWVRHTHPGSLFEYDPDMAVLCSWEWVYAHHNEWLKEKRPDIWLAASVLIDKAPVQDVDRLLKVCRDKQELDVLYAFNPLAAVEYFPEYGLIHHELFMMTFKRLVVMQEASHLLLRKSLELYVQFGKTDSQKSAVLDTDVPYAMVQHLVKAGCLTLDTYVNMNSGGK